MKRPERISLSSPLEGARDWPGLLVFTQNTGRLLGKMRGNARVDQLAAIGMHGPFRVDSEQNFHAFARAVVDLALRAYRDEGPYAA